jgi:hypothetical protein
MRGITSGCLTGPPIEKISKPGKAYLLATIVEKNGDKTRWIKAFIFSESACEEVRRLSDGDPIAVAGEIDATIYAPPGAEPRVNWSIMVDAVISAHRKPKAKRESSILRARTASVGPADGKTTAERSWAAPASSTQAGADFNDDIPF